MKIDTIVCADFFDIVSTLPESSVNLIVSDWPYYKVKALDWDRQWKTAEEYLDWIGLVCEQYRRILAPNGSLYVFASPKMAARVEVKVSEYFNVLENITWVKPNPSGKINRGAGRGGQACKEKLRSFFPRTEEIIFAEHYGADNAAKGESGYGAKCDELRGFVFESLRAYFVKEKERFGLTNKIINEVLGTATTGSGMAGHYFKPSGLVQWSLPTRAFYEKLQSNTNGFERSYESLRAEYEDLRAEYEDLRRPFNVTAQDQYTDVWEFPTVKAYPSKHPCEKPLVMIEHIIKASSREGDLVADFFCGSGTTAEAAMNLDRRFLCFDVSPEYVKLANERIKKAKPEMSQLNFSV